MLRKLMLVGVSVFMFGCGATVSEVEPATETPEGPSEDEMQKVMQESIERGGAQGRYEVPSGGN
jgi:hypothetical protein